MGIWPVAHQIAYDGVQDFKAGKLSYRKLSNRLMLDALHPAQQLELIAALESKDYRKFVSRYAEIKTENTHFKYETPFRSAAEQTPAGRTWLGLMTFFRGVWEAAYQNGVKPFFRGVRNGNARQIYQGAKAMFGLYVGFQAANAICKGITGKDAYDLWDVLTRYTPLAPGAAKVITVMGDIDKTQWQAKNENWPAKKTAERIVNIIGENIEEFIPGCDVYENIYESANDVRGVKVWRLVRKKLKEKYQNQHGRPFNAADRTTIQKFRHAFYGGDEKPEAKRPSPKAKITKRQTGERQRR